MATATIRLVGDARMPATDDASSAAASASLTLPDGILDNDVVVIVGGPRNATLTPSVTTTGGQTWTSGTQIQANNLTVNYHWCRVSGAFTNPTVGWTTSSSYGLWLTVWRGVDTTTAIDVALTTASQAAAATYTNASSFITTATNGAMVVHGFMSSDNNVWGSHSGGYDLPYARTQWRNANTTGVSLTLGYQIQNTAGGSAAYSASQATLGNDAGVRFAFALKPATVTAEANFAKVDDIDTGTGTSAVTKTGYAGRPKLVLGFQTRVVGASGGIDGLKQGFCVMAEGKQRALYAGAVDNVGFGDSVIAMAKNVFAVAFNPYNGAGGDVYGGANQVGQATLVATADGVTFTPSDAFGENGRIPILALGGDDIVAADIADFTLPLATGSVTYSNLFPFAPDFLIFPNTWSNDTAWNQITNVVDSDECVGFALGFVDSSTNQAALIGGANSQASGATTGSSLSKTGSAYLEFDWSAEFNASHALRYDGAVTALTSSGFTMNWTTVSGTTSAANLRSVVGVKLTTAGKMKVINANSATSVTTVDITTDTGGASLSASNYCAAFIGSGCHGTTTTPRTDETLTVGFSDGTNHRAAFWWYDEGGGSGGSVPTDDRSYLTSSYAYVQRSNDSSSTAVGSATVSSLSGKVTLNFDDGDPSANTIVGFVFGPAAATTVTGTLGVTTAVPTLAAAASQTITSTLAATTSLPVLSAAGNQIHLSTLASTTTLPTLAAAANQTALSTLAVTTDLPSLAANGIVGSPVGNLAVTTEAPTLAAAGTPVASSTLDVTTPLPTLAASGTTAVVATLAATTQVPTLAAQQSASAVGIFRSRPRKQNKNWHP